LVQTLGTAFAILELIAKESIQGVLMERVTSAASIARGHSQRLAPGARDYTGQMDKANRLRAQEEGVLGTVDERLQDVQGRVKTLEALAAAQQETISSLQSTIVRQAEWAERYIIDLWNDVFPDEDESKSNPTAKAAAVAK
jgi:hypothetical protein